MYISSSFDIGATVYILHPDACMVIRGEVTHINIRKEAGLTTVRYGVTYTHTDGREVRDERRGDDLYIRPESAFYEWDRAHPQAAEPEAFAASDQSTSRASA